MRRLPYLILSAILLCTILLQAKESVRLENGEKRFRNLQRYKLEDFNCNWDIQYLELFNFDADSRDGKHFHIDKKTPLRTTFRAGTLRETPQTRKAHRWLMHSILKESYFWKRMLLPPGLGYGFMTLHFTTSDGRLKAIETKEDILQMFGRIDTEIELLLWLYVIDITGPYSYKKTKEGYRLHYSGTNPFSCEYEEYFIFLNATTGKRSEPKWLKRYPVKGCAIIQP
jgi:hypothetical protein